MKHLPTEPRLDPPDSPELFFKCDECGDTESDAYNDIKDGDACPYCLHKEERGIYRTYEQPERDWEDYDDN